MESRDNIRIRGQRRKSTDGCLNLRGCTLTGQAGSKGQGQDQDQADISSAPSPLTAPAPGRSVSTRPSSSSSQCLPGHPVTTGTSPRPGLTAGFPH